MIPEQFYKLIADHGGITGTRIVDPLVTDENGIKSPNTDPQYVYTFADGTSLVARSVDNYPDAPGAASFEITDWGDAGPKAASSQVPHTINTADGRTLAWNPDSKNWTEIAAKGGAAKGEPNTIVYIPGTQIPVGMYDSTGKYRDLTATEQRALGVGASGGGGGAGGGGSVGRVRFPDEIAQNEAQTGYLQAQTDKIRADMARADRPETGLLLDNYLKTVDQVQQMLASGKLQVGEADGIVGLLQQNMRAAMAGTTPFQQAKQAQDTETQRAQIGQSLLNQRVSSGLSLANSLSDQFSSNLGTLGWGLAPGQTVRFNPFQAARQAVNEQGGGPEAGNLATALLQAARPAGMPGQAPTPSPAPSASGLPAAVLLALQAADEAMNRRQQQQPQLQEVGQ
ncbi:MAG: hypothetical protein M0Z94_19720 [Dehalococcoidales bacterium]|nr:hypothetical protein [Dehalococcoidales bacterium]